MTSEHNRQQFRGPSKSRCLIFLEKLQHQYRDPRNNDLKMLELEIECIWKPVTLSEEMTVVYLPFLRNYQEKEQVYFSVQISY